LKRYITGKSRNETVRRAAILIVQFAGLVELQQDLLKIALDRTEPYSVRTAAATAVLGIGDDSTKAALKTLVFSTSTDDPRDELKGAALAASWPLYLSIEDLLTVLTPPHQANFIGKYRQFLASDFAQGISASDMVNALKWARPHVTRQDAGIRPLGGAALQIVTAAIDHFREPGVCDLLVEMLRQIARTSAGSLRLMSKVASHREAHRAIAMPAMSLAESPEDIHGEIQYGLIDADDLPDLLRDLAIAPRGLAQEKIAFAIAALTIGQRKQMQPEMVERVTTVAETFPVLAEALKDASDRRKEIERQLAEYDTAIPTAELDAESPPPSLDDLLASSEPDRVVPLFAKICDRLSGANCSPECEILRSWQALPMGVQQQVAKAADIYLNGCCLVSDSWIENLQGWNLVTYGSCALRLLAQAARGRFTQLNADVWYAWMPSAFGEPFGQQPPDAMQIEILKAGYERVPTRFLELLARFMSAENTAFGDIWILDKADPLWNEDIAALVRQKLGGQDLAPKAFRRILRALIRKGDESAFRVASDVVKGALAAPTSELELPIEVARELLNSVPTRAWEVVWPVMKQNSEFAGRLLSALAIDPYSSETTHLMQGLREQELADLWSWLTEHYVTDQVERDVPTDARIGGFTPLNGSPARGWHWLRIVVMDALIQRGTSEAVEAIRRLKTETAEEGLKRAVEAAEEVLRQKSWRPRLPSDLFNLAAYRSMAQESKARGVKPHVAAAPSSARSGKRGRRADADRRAAIHEEISKYGDAWRDHTSEIFHSLDNREIAMGDFAGTEIPLTNGQSTTAWTWEALDLAEGVLRRRILDSLRKY
jgi:hypothetical protein